MGAFADTVLTVQRRRSGGKQVVQVIHQQVAVGAGGKAIVAGTVKGRRKTAGSGRGAEVRSGGRPNKPDWKAALALAQSAPRCRARCRVSKLPCRGPAMRGKAVCRLHGGKGGGPKGERNGAYRTGSYTVEAKAGRQATRILIRELRRLIDAGG